MRRAVCVVPSTQPGFSEKSKDPSVAGGAQSLGEDGWYTFESPRGDRYRYRLEALAGCLEDEVNTEEGRLAEQQRHNRRELARALDRERFQRLKLQSVDFDPSPVPSVFQFNGFNEIVKATGFDADNMCVPRAAHACAAHCCHLPHSLARACVLLCVQLCGV